MRFRNTRLRTKITALLLSLVALWAFAAWVTLREGVNLLWVSVVNSSVAQPLDKVQPELQAERRLSLVRIADPRPRDREALEAQRGRTDKAIARFEKLARGGDVKRSESAQLKHAIDAGISEFQALRGSRAAIDSGLIDRDDAAAAYDRAVAAIFQIDDSLATLDDKDFARDVRTMVELNRAREIVSQEDALLSGILASRKFTHTDYEDLLQTVGARKHAFTKVLTDLANADRISYGLAANGPAINRFLAVEKTLVTRSRPGKPLPVDAAQWRAATDPALAQLSQAVFGGGDRLVQRAQPIAVGVIVRLALAGGLGLLAVITSIIVSITTSRALLRQLEKLRNAARELAEKRLPSVVERLGHGENVDVAAEAPPLSFGSDEIGQVGRAFNKVQETAIRTAVEQAELRRGIRDVLLSLARRSQALVHRQLTLLDDMERQRDDAKDLEELFRIDHLATRMRRNAENLIVLSGATPARGWRRPVPMIDVVRSAVAEVEDYTRVSVSSAMGDAALAGRAVGDIVHLLAELIENAVSFSPPYTQAEVSGRPVARGYAIEIEDRGLGMTDEILAAVNERISNPPEFNLSSSVHLGLFVVGRLAERYDARVSLKHSSYGGTTAVVLIPRELLAGPVADGTETTADDRAAAGALPAAVGAHRETTRPAVAVARPLPVGDDRYPEESAEPPRDPHSDLPMRRRKIHTLRTVPDMPAPGDRAPGDGVPRDGVPNDGVPNDGVPDGSAPADSARVGLVRDKPDADARPDDAGARASAAAGPAPETTGTGGEPTLPQKSGSGDLEEARTTDMSHTPHGLPVRVPQASIAEPLRAGGPSTRQDEDEAAPGDRSPENVRRSVSGLQAATRRGRADAAKSRTDGGGRPDPTADDEA